MKMTRRLPMALTCLVAASSIALFSAPVASADTIQCENSIVDTTHKQVLNTTAVQAAVDGVAAQGADVYVRAFQDTPGGNADAFWSQGLRQCSNWRTPDGKPKANIIMVMFGMDRTSGIFYNASSFPELNDEFGSIISSDMNPNFRSGDFSRGIVSALNSIAHTIDPNRTETTIIDNTPDTDYSGVWKMTLWIFIGIALTVGFAAALVFGGRAVRRRREEKTEWLKERAAARSAKDKLDRAIPNLRRDGDLEREFLIASAGVPSSVLKARRSEFSKIDERYDDIDESYPATVTNPDYDPEREHTTTQYREMVKEFSRITTAIKAVDEDFATLLANLEEDKEKLTLESRTRALDAVTRDTDTLASALGRCEQVFEVAQQRNELDVVKRRIETARLQLQAEGREEESYNEIAALRAEVSSLTVSIRSLESDRDTIMSAQKQVDAAVAARRSTLSRLEHVDTEEPLRRLDRAARGADDLYRRLEQSRVRTSQLAAIDTFVASINATGEKSVQANRKTTDRLAAEATARRRKEEEQRAEERRQEARRSSSFTNSSTGGFAGGYLGGTLGNSGGSSSYDSGGSSFGGGGSSWGGGGGDSGGGGGGW